MCLSCLTNPASKTGAWVFHFGSKYAMSLAKLATLMRSQGFQWQVCAFRTGGKEEGHETKQKQRHQQSGMPA